LYAPRMHPFGLTSKWAPQEAAARYLGMSQKTLYRWRRVGLLKPSVHYRRKFPAANSPLLYHLELCEQVMAEACSTDPRTLELSQ
jgi:hypothetical protein